MKNKVELKYKAYFVSVGYSFIKHFTLEDISPLEVISNNQEKLFQICNTGVYSVVHKEGPDYIIYRVYEQLPKWLNLEGQFLDYVRVIDITNKTSKQLSDILNSADWASIDV